MKLYEDNGRFTPEACAYFWPNDEPTEELKAVHDYTQEDWGDAMEVIHLLRERWVAEQLEAMRSEAARAIVVKRLEEAGVNRDLTQAQREEVADQILADLTTPQLRTYSEHEADKERLIPANGEHRIDEESA